MTNADIRQRITDEIIASVETGTLPWRRPWSKKFPQNFVSKRRYSGINPLLLEIASMRYGFSSHQWGTFKQWTQRGGRVKRRPSNVRPGQWGTKIVFAKPIAKVERDAVGNELERRFTLLREYVVFNADQVDGVRLNDGIEATDETDPNDEAERVIQATGADIRYGGNAAYYHKEDDYIRIPPKSQFVGEYYPTIFHELAHWSEKRLGWNASYAEAELVAEIASCFLSSSVGIEVAETLPNHAAYVASWLQRMREDSGLIVRAASQASKATDFILGFSQTTVAESLDEQLVET